MAQSIAVIIPCLNHAAELKGALESLRQQTLQAQEIVVVDNGSDDDPAAVVQGFGDLPIRFERFTQRKGAPAARNRGATLTSAPWMIFLDAHVRLEPEALQKMAQSLELHPEVDFVYSDFVWDFKKFHLQAWDVAALKKLNYIHTSALLRRSVFPGFDENLTKFQDWDMWLTMAEKGSRGFWIDEFLFKVASHKSHYSSWLPSFVHRIPWPILGWTPREIEKYRAAEKIIRLKHGI